MSFICDKCWKTQPNGSKPERVVMETRKKKYENSGKISYGWEIVREENRCSNCGNN